MQRLVAGSSQGYQQQVETSLNLVVSGLQGEVEKKKMMAERKARSLHADVLRLTSFQQSAKKLK